MLTGQATSETRSSRQDTPLPNAESALIKTLAPGNYTEIVNGLNGATGVALVEVYGLD
jgi:hypothetical protein